MKARKGRFSGTIGNEVYVNSKYGQVVRSRPRRPSLPTADRLRARCDLSRVANAWRRRTDEQFAAWTAAAIQANSQAPAGSSASLDAYHLFCMINCARVAAGLPIIMFPPKPEKFRPNPVAELRATNRGGVITLRLRVVATASVRSWNSTRRSSTCSRPKSPTPTPNTNTCSGAPP